VGKKKRMGEWARKKGRKKGPMGKSKKKRRNPLRTKPGHAASCLPKPKKIQKKSKMKRTAKGS